MQLQQLQAPGLTASAGLTAAAAPPGRAGPPRPRSAHPQLHVGTRVSCNPCAGGWGSARLRAAPLGHTRARPAAHPCHDLGHPAAQHRVQRLLVPCSACRSLTGRWQPPQELCETPRVGDGEHASSAAPAMPQRLGLCALGPAWAGVTWRALREGPAGCPGRTHKRTSLIETCPQPRRRPIRTHPHPLGPALPPGPVQAARRSSKAAWPPAAPWAAAEARSSGCHRAAAGGWAAAAGRCSRDEPPRRALAPRHSSSGSSD